jgi:PPP family 3-phenylpropionic acid transporter
MPLSAPRALSLFYLTSFAVLGVYLPWFNLHLKDLGFTAAQIGALSALLPLCGAVVPAAGGILADRIGRRREVVAAASLLAFLAFGLVPGARGFPAMALAIGLYAALRAPALPLVEATAIEVSEGGGPHYGRMRAWGSAAFIVTAFAAGRAVGLAGAGIVVPAILVLLGLNALAALLLPRAALPAGPRPAGGGLAAFLRRRDILLFLLACLLSQAAHGPYYVFYSIHLEGAGYAPAAIGGLWALAVVCEIAVMVGLRRVLLRHGPPAILALGLMLAAARWTLCAVSIAPPAMLLAQALHAFTFGAFHVAAVTHAHRLFGGARAASGQAIYGAATYGAGNVLGMALSGILHDRAGMSGLFAGAAAASLLGALLIPAAAGRWPIMGGHRGRSDA